MSNNGSNLIFGSKTNLVLAATPSTGSYLVAYDSAGYLSQKDDQGVVSRIGVAPTASGVLETFLSDITLSLSPGKSFGKYVSGDTIQAVGKTAVEVIIDALTEPITPTVSLNSLTTIAFNQTAISNVLTYTYSINTIGATAASVLLEYRRNGLGSWATLSTDKNLFTFTHSLTDTGFNTQPFNYRYTMTDSQGATNFTTKNITPAAYIAPSISSFSVIAATLSSIETNSKREKGNIVSNISGLITRNSTNVGLSNYQLEYQKNGTGPWVNISTVSISGATAAISFLNHNDTINLSDANSIGYRVKVTDSNQTTTSSTSLVNLLNIIFYGPIGATPSNSGDIRALPSKIFTDGPNPFNLSTGNVERNFTVAMPSTLSISEVKDLDALSAIITNNYVLNTFNVSDFYGTNISYKVYTMTNAVAYSDLPTHRHQVTRT